MFPFDTTLSATLFAYVHNECANNSVAFHHNYKIFNMNFSCALPKHMFVPTFGCHLEELRKITLDWFRFEELTLQNGTPYCISLNTKREKCEQQIKWEFYLYWCVSHDPFGAENLEKTESLLTTTCRMRSRAQLYLTWRSWMYWKQS